MLSVSTFIIILLTAYIVVNIYMQTRDMKRFCDQLSEISAKTKIVLEHINIQEQRQESMHKCITELKDIDKTLITGAVVHAKVTTMANLSVSAIAEGSTISHPENWISFPTTGLIEVTCALAVSNPLLGMADHPAVPHRPHRHSAAFP